MTFIFYGFNRTDWTKAVNLNTLLLAPKQVNQIYLHIFVGLWIILSDFREKNFPERVVKRAVGQEVTFIFCGFKDDRAFSLLHQELPQILVLCFP